MNENEIENEAAFSPRDFMRARRPELFSDAIASTEEPPVDRVVFEYHLDTLTSRKEETRFEHFCRRLSEKELCPNLLPQTGPTGGGDSKVDSETYPVDNSIAERWFFGEQQAASERWAFAFSAKKDWRAKVKSDVKKIAETNRQYSRIYFVTNQYVADRDRSSLEDELSRDWKYDVRILDRTWIIDRVFTNQRWEIVYQTLDVERPKREPTMLPGSLDAKRRMELSELDSLIGDPQRYEGSDYQLVEDCLQSALLARAIGVARTEVDGRFDRAERLARSRGKNSQLFRIFYDRAWTAYWWFEDFYEFDRLYAEAESLAVDSTNVWDVEKLVNLWQIGIVAAVKSADAVCRERWDNRYEKLKSALIGQTQDIEKPTSSLWAKTELCRMRFTLAAISGDSHANVLRDLKGIIESAEGHLDYPFEPVSQIVTELGTYLGEQDGYEELFEVVMRLQSTRAGRGEEGRFRLERGGQKLQVGDYYGAILHFALAQNLLAHEEHREEFMRAVAGTALGYEAVGLFWAARANLVFALDRAIHEYQTSGSVAPQAVPLLRKLIWTELQLGRVPCALLWVEMLNVILQVVELDKQRREDVQKERLIMDGVFGILMLRTTASDWLYLDRVPAYLDSIGLPMAREAALFALGHEDMVRLEVGQPDEDLDEFYGMLLRSPAAADVPDTTEWHLDENVLMETAILGCHVRLIATNQPATIAWGEAILAFLEAFFSTAPSVPRAVSLRPSLDIRFAPSSKHGGPPFSTAVNEDECGETSILVSHSGNSSLVSIRDESFHKAFIDLLGTVFAQLHIPEADQWLKTYFANERAQDRASLSAQSIQAVRNVLGEQPKYSMASQLEKTTISERLPYMRSEPWRPPQPAEASDGRETASASPSPSDEGIKSVTDGLTRKRQKDFAVISVINLPLWDRAGWKGALFITWFDAHVPPVLALYFKDGDAAHKILSGWQRRFGDVDENEEIQITIITGIDKTHPTRYRIAVGSKLNMDVGKAGGNRYFVQVLRFQEMTPDSSANLDRFLSAFKSVGAYRLSAATDLPTPVVNNLMIEKHELRIVPAWKIGPNDPVMSALKNVMNPVVPVGEKHAPVWEALKRLQ